MSEHGAPSARDSVFVDYQGAEDTPSASVSPRSSRIRSGLDVSEAQQIADQVQHCQPRSCWCLGAMSTRHSCAAGYKSCSPRMCLLVSWCLASFAMLLNARLVLGGCVLCSHRGAATIYSGDVSLSYAMQANDARGARSAAQSTVRFSQDPARALRSQGSFAQSALRGALLHNCRSTCCVPMPVATLALLSWPSTKPTLAGVQVAWRLCRRRRRSRFCSW